MILWNAALLLVGHATAVGYLRSGRPWPGLLLVAGLWTALDTALVMRFALGRPESEWKWALLAMQVLAGVSTARFFFLRIRRGTKGHLEIRDRLFRQGLSAFVRDDLESARTTFRRIARRDPWDRDAREAFAMARSARPLAHEGSRQRRAPSGRRGLT